MLSRSQTKMRKTNEFGMTKKNDSLPPFHSRSPAVPFWLSSSGKCLCGERWQIYSAIPFVHVVNHVKSLMNPLFCSPFLFLLLALSLRSILFLVCFVFVRSFLFLQICLRLVWFGSVRSGRGLFFIWLDADRLLRITIDPRPKFWNYETFAYGLLLLFILYIFVCECVHVYVIEIREWYGIKIPFRDSWPEREREMEINFRNLNMCVVPRRKSEKRPARERAKGEGWGSDGAHGTKRIVRYGYSCVLIRLSSCIAECQSAGRCYFRK